MPEDREVVYFRCAQWHYDHQCVKLPNHPGHCIIISDYGQLEHVYHSEQEFEDAQVETCTL